MVHMRIGQLPALARGSVVEMSDNIVTAISEICAGNGVLAPTSLCGQRSSPTTDSFVETQVASHEAFAKLLLPDPVVEKSAYGTAEPGFKLDFSQHFVRIVNRSFAITHSSTFTGMLLHESSKKNEVEAWLNMLRADESSPLYGLRPAQDSYEEQLGLHILAAHVEPISLGTKVSCYGAGGHPGKRLSVRDGCSLFCIKRSIKPLEFWVRSDFFVLPCTKQSAVPNAEELRLPLFEMLEDAVKSMVEAFEGNVKDKLPAKMNLATACVARNQSPEERFYGTAWGLGLEVEASTVGAVYEELVKRTSNATALSLLFLAMVSKVGKNASVVEAWSWLKESIINSAKQIADLEVEVEQLRAKVLLPEIAPVVVEEEPAVVVEQVVVDHLLLDLTDVSIKRATSAAGLEAGAGSIKLMNTASEEEIEKLITLFAKSLNTSKKKLPSEVISAAKATHSAIALESPIKRVLAVANVVEGGTRPLLMTNMFVLSQSSTTSKLYQAQAGGEKGVNLDVFLKDSATLVHFVETTCILYYFTKQA